MKSTPKVTTVASVASKPVEWLWDLRIPRGRLTMLDGDPGMGKSILTIAIASAVTRGVPLPESCTPTVKGSVLFLSAEDELQTTVKPRLEAQAADLSRVHVFEALRTEEFDVLPTFPSCLKWLKDVVQDHRPALVVIDPIMAYLDERVHTYSDQSVRHALAGIKSLAESFDFAALLVRHLNKKSEGRAIYRGGGSIGLIGLARSGLMVADSPENPAEKLLVQTKSNLGSRAPPLAYELDFTGRGPLIHWRGVRDILPDQLLKMVIPSLKIDVAVEFLEKLLKSGPVLVRDIARQAKERSIAFRLLRLAKKRLGLVAQKPHRDWYWSFPGSTQPKMEDLWPKDEAAKKGSERRSTR